MYSFRQINHNENCKLSSVVFLRLNLLLLDLAGNLSCSQHAYSELFLTRVRVEYCFFWFLYLWSLCQKIYLYLTKRKPN